MRQPARERGRRRRPFDRKQSRRDHPLMQAADRVERREDRPLLPGGNEGGVFAGEHNPSVDPAKVVVMGTTRFVRPIAGAAQREGRPSQATATPFSNSARYCGWI